MADNASNVLVSTDWAVEHLDDAGLRFVEVDVNTYHYDKGHLPGAVGWNWQTQLQDGVQRDVASKADFEKLLQASGIDADTTVILYGDNSNWFAAYAYWLLKYYGHDKVKLVDGGRAKLEAEGRAFTTDVPSYEATSYTLPGVRPELRALSRDVFKHLEQENPALVDVRSPDEFSGKVLAPPGLNETAQRGGHIPGASNIPWSKAVNEDGRFKATDELRALYEGLGVTPDKPVITYCRIGERAAHSWFVLQELLGYEDVRNYDGSWTEWGNLIGAPIEKGAPSKSA